MSFLDALEGAGNGKPRCARGVKRNSSGVKHFLEGVKKNLRGFNPPENPPMLVNMNGIIDNYRSGVVMHGKAPTTCMIQHDMPYTGTL